MAIFLKRNGSWREVEEPYIKRNGDWILPEEGYIKQNGQWKLIFERFEFEVETTGASEDVDTATLNGQLTEFEDFSTSNFLKQKLDDSVGAPSLAVDSARQIIVVGGNDDTVYVYDRSFDLIETLDEPIDQVLSVDFNESNGRLVVGTASNQFHVYNSNFGFLQTISDPTGGVASVAYNENLNYILAGSLDSKIRVYDGNFNLINELDQPNQGVRSVGWRSSDNWFAAGSDDGNIYIFDGSASLRQTLTDTTGRVNGLDWSESGMLAAVDTEKAYIYTNNFSLTEQLGGGNEGDQGAVAWDKNGRVAHASTDGNVYLYNNTFDNVGVLEDPSRKHSAAEWSDNNFLVTGTNELGAGNAYGFSTGVSVFFEWGETGQGFPNTARAGSILQTDTFSTQIEGLTKTTSYEFRAGAETTEDRKTFGDTILFTTGDIVVEVETRQAQNVFANGADLRGEVTKFQGFDDPGDAFFRWGEQGGSLPNTLDAGQVNSTGNVKETLSGIDDDKTYEFRFVVQAGSEQDQGNTLTFTTPETSISVETLSESGVSSKEATLNGELTEFSGTTNDADVRFEYGEEGAGLNQTIDAGTRSSTGTFDATATGLDTGTTYEYRAVASSTGETSKGGIVTFTTDDTALSVATRDASDIKTDRATIEGEITQYENFQGDAEVYFEWGESGTGLPNQTSVQTQSGTGTFTETLEGLNKDTQYEFRAFGEAGSKTRSGSLETFTTEEGNVETNTTGTSSVTTTSSTLEGELVEFNGFPQGTEADISFDWGRSGEGLPNTVSVGSTSNTGPFSATIQNLRQDVEYEFQAVAEAENITDTGSLITFTTADGDTEIETVSSNADRTQAILNGSVNDLREKGGSEGKTALLQFGYKSLSGESGTLFETTNFEEENVFFEWGRTGNGFPNTTSPQPVEETVDFSETINGLSAGTQYQFRAVSESGAEGQVLAFTTDNKIITEPATGVGTSEATLNGEIFETSGSKTFESSLTQFGLEELYGTNQIQGFETQEVYFEWGESGNGLPNSTAPQTVNEPQAFQETISGLNGGQEYEFKAVGSEGAEGDVLTFTTS